MPARLGRETIICCERLMKYVRRLDETVTVHLRIAVRKMSRTFLCFSLSWYKTGTECLAGDSPDRDEVLINIPHHNVTLRTREIISSHPRRFTGGRIFPSFLPRAADKCFFIKSLKSSRKFNGDWHASLPGIDTESYPSDWIMHWRITKKRLWAWRNARSWGEI